MEKKKIGLNNKNWLLVVLSLMFALLMGEVLLRAIGFSYPSLTRYDLDLGVALLPGAEGWYRNEGLAYVRINSQGMRDDRDIQVEKPKDVYRIAVLGDSYAEALQVDTDKTFWRLLETKLMQCRYGRSKRIEVLNFGVSGYSTAQEYITLKTRVAPFQPDHVLLAFLSGNDVRDNSKELAGNYPRPFFTLTDGQLREDNSFRENWIFKLKSSRLWQVRHEISKYSRILQLLNKVVNIVVQPYAAPRSQGGVQEIGLDDHIYLSSPPPKWERAWQLTEALILETKREAERQGARFTLVTLSNPAQVHPDPEKIRQYAAKLGEADLFYPERRMSALVKREGIDAIILAQPFAQYAQAHRVFLHGFPNTVMGGGHWNETGHALAAELIAQHLCKSMH